MKRLWKFIWPLLKNKYVVTLAGFVIWLTFFSQYNLMDRFGMMRNMRQLKQEKVYYIEQIRQDSTRLHQLTSNNANLEKFAREQYYMKKPNEDIFIVVE